MRLYLLLLFLIPSILKLSGQDVELSLIPASIRSCGDLLLNCNETPKTMCFDIVLETDFTDNLRGYTIVINEVNGILKPGIMPINTSCVITSVVDNADPIANPNGNGQIFNASGIGTLGMVADQAVVVHTFCIQIENGSTVTFEGIELNTEFTETGVVNVNSLSGFTIYNFDDVCNCNNETIVLDTTICEGSSLLIGNTLYT